MGVYDTIEVDCPKCGNKEVIQVKLAYYPCLAKRKIGENLLLLRETYHHKCENCGTLFDAFFKAKILPPKLKVISKKQDMKEKKQLRQSVKKLEKELQRERLRNLVETLKREPEERIVESANYTPTLKHLKEELDLLLKLYKRTKFDSLEWKVTKRRIE